MEILLLNDIAGLIISEIEGASTTNIVEKIRKVYCDG